MIQAVIETCLYVDDLSANVAFYRDTLGFRLLSADDRLAAFSVADRQMLLIFRRGGTPAPIPTPGGQIPPHDGVGTTHVGFGIAPADLDAWRSRLEAAGVRLLSTVRWPRGGESLYFHDPEGNLVELLTPGVWEIY